MEIENLTFYTLSNKNLGKKSGIYKISYEEHIYIGSSKNLYTRLTEHKTDLCYNRHSNTFLQNVANKVGVDKLRIDIIEFCDPLVRTKREKFWIDTYKSDMNFKDPVTNTLSEESKQKLSESVKKGIAEGKYKTKYDFVSIECYDYFGQYITTYDNRQDAAIKCGLSVKEIQKCASGYKKGVINSQTGYRFRYSNSTVPVQQFTPNVQYIGKYYNFYYKDENGIEKFAFSNIKDVWKFFGNHAKDSQITIIPKLKAEKIKLCESGNLLCDEDNPNPSAIEI